MAGRIGCPQYMAPEVVSRRMYGKGCDIWGAGVMLHVLLSGRLPFLGSGKRLQDIISRGRVVVCSHLISSTQFHYYEIINSFPYLMLLTMFIEQSKWLLFFVKQLEAPEWKSISSNAKDLVLKMLAPNPHNRLTIEEVLDHPWMRVNIIPTLRIHPFINIFFPVVRSFISFSCHWHRLRYVVVSCYWHYVTTLNTE